jgi:hypothetical protein
VLCAFNHSLPRRDLGVKVLAVHFLLDFNTEAIPDLDHFLLVVFQTNCAVNLRELGKMSCNHFLILKASVQLPLSIVEIRQENKIEQSNEEFLKVIIFLLRDDNLIIKICCLILGVIGNVKDLVFNGYPSHFHVRRTFPHKSLKRCSIHFTIILGRNNRFQKHSRLGTAAPMRRHSAVPGCG